MTAHLTDIEGEIYQHRNRSSQDPLNYPIRLNNKLAALQGVVEAGDGAPTAQSVAVFADLSGRLDIQLKRVDAAVAKDVAAFNATLTSRQLAPIVTTVPTLEEVAAMGTSTADLEADGATHAPVRASGDDHAPRYRYIVSGRVQGVGFRAFVADAARAEGLAGWVRNLPDGRVEVHAEGDAEALGRFEWRLWQGPAMARVDDVVARRWCRAAPPAFASRDQQEGRRPDPSTTEEHRLRHDMQTCSRPRFATSPTSRSRASCSTTSPRCCAIPKALRLALDAMAAPFIEAQIDLVVGMESRGFIFGAALADRLHAGFVPVRKPGKLPARSLRVSYDLEYGSDALEIHADAIEAGQRVLIVDDLLATGGTAAATIELRLGLRGRDRGLRVPGRADVPERPRQARHDAGPCRPAVRRLGAPCSGMARQCIMADGPQDGRPARGDAGLRTRERVAQTDRAAAS